VDRIADLGFDLRIEDVVDEGERVLRMRRILGNGEVVDEEIGALLRTT